MALVSGFLAAVDGISLKICFAAWVDDWVILTGSITGCTAVGKKIKPNAFGGFKLLWQYQNLQKLLILLPFFSLSNTFFPEVCLWPGRLARTSIPLSLYLKDKVLIRWFNCIMNQNTFLRCKLTPHLKSDTVNEPAKYPLP